MVAVDENPYDHNVIDEKTRSDGQISSDEIEVDTHVLTRVTTKASRSGSAQDDTIAIKRKHAQPQLLSYDPAPW